MDLDQVNHAIRIAIEQTEFYWIIPLALAVVNLVLMYNLDAPVSVGGRAARVIAYMAHILVIAATWYTAVRLFALTFELLAWAILNGQYIYECRIRKQHLGKPAYVGTAVEKFAAALTGKPSYYRHALRREDELWMASGSGREKPE